MSSRVCCASFVYPRAPCACQRRALYLCLPVSVSLHVLCVSLHLSVRLCDCLCASVCMVVHMFDCLCPRRAVLSILVIVSLCTCLYVWVIFFVLVSVWLSTCLFSSAPCCLYLWLFLSVPVCPSQFLWLSVCGGLHVCLSVCLCPRRAVCIVGLCASAYQFVTVLLSVSCVQCCLYVHTVFWLAVCLCVWVSVKLPTLSCWSNLGPFFHYLSGGGVGSFS